VTRNHLSLGAIVVVAIFLLTTTAVPAGAHPMGAPSSGAHLPGLPRSSAAAPAAPRAAALEKSQAAEKATEAQKVPAGLYHPPDFSAEGARPHGPVAPTYIAAPAPMGVADLGLKNSAGTLVPYTLNSSSVAGTIALTSAQSVYVDGDGPDTFGVQLNAVATNVTLFGNSSFEFWTQNFVSYTSSSGQLTFGDNVWNFSDLAGLFPSNAIYSHGPNGTLVAPEYYYASGPSFTVRYPFTVMFFLNATTLNDRPAIYFNYTLSSPSITTHYGSFDFVVFNSTVGTPLAPAAVPMFQVNGAAYDPTGLLNDVELVVVGNGGGDTTTFFSMKATLTIDFWNDSAEAYQSFPSAFDAGADTGETSDGIDVSFNATLLGAPLMVANLNLGPSFLYGLWNVLNNPGSRILGQTQSPANAFLFVNPGATFKPLDAQWVPTALLASLGAMSVYFPNKGTYFFEWLLSDYRSTGKAFTVLAAPNNLTTAVSTTLVSATGTGVYTPLIAWGNGELGAIASSGNGTNASPYTLENAAPSQLGAEFTQWNDFEFPVFPGVLLVETSDWVRATPAGFAITYPASVAPTLTSLGLPSSNHLQLEFWKVSNLSLSNAPLITGWISSNFGGFPAAAATFWNSSNNLISGNTFLDQGASLALYGGTNNTVWGNSFLPTPVAASNQTAIQDSGNNTTGIFESESGDLVYNNYFTVPQPAYTPTIDPFSCQYICTSVTYSDRWNVSLEPANDTQTVLGRVLTGSIILTSYQGGNYWSNYGTTSDPYGILPYNDAGRISNGGDYYPLIPFALYSVTFSETGLAVSAAEWGVSAVGLNQSAAPGATITVFAPNGTYNFSVVVPAGYTVTAPANFTVDGANLSVGLPFSPLLPLEFIETGLAESWSWTVNLTPLALGQPNVTGTSTNGTDTFALVAGSYLYNITSTGYNATPANGTVLVASGIPAIDVVFSLVPILEINETGLPAGVAWTAAIHDGPSWSNKTSVGTQINFFVFDLAPGAYTWHISATNYTATHRFGHGTSPNPTYVTPVFSIDLGTLVGSINVPSATVTIDGNSVLVTNGTFSALLGAGVHSIYATADGYEPYYNNVTVAGGTTTNFAIQMNAVPGPSPGLLGISALGWALIAALAIVALVLLLVALTFRRRARTRPPAAAFRLPRPAAPAAAAKAPAAPPAAPVPPPPVPKPSAPAAPPTPPAWSEDSTEAPWSEGS
jgi:thermopsin